MPLLLPVSAISPLQTILPGRFLLLEIKPVMLRMSLLQIVCYHQVLLASGWVTATSETGILIYGMENSVIENIPLESIDVNPAPVSKGLSAIMLRDGTNAVLRNCSTNDGSVLLKKEMVK